MLIKFLLVLLFAFLSLGQFSVVSQVGESKVYLYDLFVLVFVLFGFGYLLFKKNKIIIPKYHVLFYVFSFWALFTLFPRVFRLTTLEVVISASYLARFLLYLLSASLITNLLTNKIISEKFFYNLILYSLLFVSFIGFLQVIILPDFSTLDPSLGWDPHKNRLASTFFDPNFTGNFLVLGLILLLGWGFEPKKANFVYLSVILLAIFLTFSRSTWAMVAVTVLILGVFKYRKLIVISLLIGFLAYFAIPRVQTRISGITDPADSAHFRLISWKNTLTIADDNLLLGVGFNAFRYAQKEYGFFDPGYLGGHSGAGSDSSFLLVLATTGVFGFSLFVLGFFLPLLPAIKDTRNMKNLSIIAGIGALTVSSQFINALFYPQILVFWLLLFVGLSPEKEISAFNKG